MPSQSMSRIISEINALGGQEAGNKRAANAKGEPCLKREMTEVGLKKDNNYNKRQLGGRR